MFILHETMCLNKTIKINKIKKNNQGGICCDSS